VERYKLNHAIRTGLSRLLLTLAGFLVRVTGLIEPQEARGDEHPDGAASADETDGWPEAWAARVKNAKQVTWFSFKAGNRVPMNRAVSQETRSSMDHAKTNENVNRETPPIAVKDTPQTGKPERPVPGMPVATEQNQEKTVSTPLRPPVTESGPRVFDPKTRQWVPISMSVPSVEKRAFEQGTSFSEIAPQVITPQAIDRTTPSMDLRETSHGRKNSGHSDASTLWTAAASQPGIPEFPRVSTDAGPVHHGEFEVQGGIPQPDNSGICPWPSLDPGFPEKPAEHVNGNTMSGHDLSPESHGPNETYEYKESRKYPRSQPPVFVQAPQSPDVPDLPCPWPELDPFDLPGTPEKTDRRGDTGRSLRLKLEQKGSLWSVSRF
jgi:hypothetical protein